MLWGELSRARLFSLLLQVLDQLGWSLIRHFPSVLVHLAAPRSNLDKLRLGPLARQVDFLLKLKDDVPPPRTRQPLSSLRKNDLCSTASSRWSPAWHSRPSSCADVTLMGGSALSPRYRGLWSSCNTEKNHQLAATHKSNARAGKLFEPLTLADSDGLRFGGVFTVLGGQIL